jgi:phosphoglucosamine mutase
MRQLFGTDGIRGKANIYPMTGEVAMALGRAVTYYFQSSNQHLPESLRKKPIIVIGKDTRLSCYMLEQAIAAGVCSQGGRAILTGPLPTAGVAFVTKSMRADAGIMISASHNPYYDNGIKIFDRAGRKLPDSVETQLEELILDQSKIDTKVNEFLGNAKRLDEAVGRYVVQTKNAFSTNESLQGLRLVVDCAHGAAYKVAPLIFEELGAEVIPLGINPNGTNINDQCGALHPAHCARAVSTYRADLGICLDGDADRLVVVDDTGKIVEGDQLIAVLAKYLLDTKQIDSSKPIVGTVMTNMAAELFLKNLGFSFKRSKVGDRYVIEQMEETGAMFGGEPSGHLIFNNFSTTGDGIVAALKTLECIRFYKKPLSQLISSIELFPQIIKNVKVAKRVPLEENTAIQNEIKLAEEKLKNDGRVLLRYSGTEPLVRVMVEGKNSQLVNELCDKLCKTVKNQLEKMDH